MIRTGNAKGNVDNNILLRMDVINHPDDPYRTPFNYSNLIVHRQGRRAKADIVRTAPGCPRAPGHRPLVGVRNLGSAESKRVEVKHLCTKICCFFFPMVPFEWETHDEKKYDQPIHGFIPDSRCIRGRTSSQGTDHGQPGDY